MREREESRKTAGVWDRDTARKKFPSPEVGRRPEEQIQQGEGGQGCSGVGSSVLEGLLDIQGNKSRTQLDT